MLMTRLSKMRLKTIFLSLLISNCIISFSQKENLSINLSYVGSSTVDNFISDAQSVLGQITFNVDTKPESSGGELAILEGRADIAGIARLPSKELLSSGVTSTLIGWDAIAIIVNKNNPIQNLTQSQLKGIYTGAFTNWREVGGPDLEIKPYIVGMESATRKVCRSIILGKDDYIAYEEVSPDVDIIERVQNDLGGIGQISFSFVKSNQSVHVLDINGQALTLTNKNYPITRPLYLLWWSGRRDVAAFVNWTLSNEGQRVVMNRFVGIKEATVTFEDETGDLLVYTKTSPVEDGGIYYYPHDGFNILRPDSSLFMNVPNHLSSNDETPSQIELLPGTYIIQTNLGSDKLQEFSITIIAGKLIKLYPERKESLYGRFNITKQPPNAVNTNIESNNRQKIDFHGDFRVRAEQDFKENTNRFRGRFRIRAGVNTSLNSKLKLGIRLVSTGNPDDPNSSHVNLTEGFNQIKVAFDKAFIHYHSKKKTTFDAWLGKFSNPNISSQVYSEILWDADIQPEGTAFSVKTPIDKKGDHLKFTNGLYLLSQFKSNNKKNWLYTSQLSGHLKIADKWLATLASGLYYYKNIKGLNIQANFIDHNDGNLFYESITTENMDTTISMHYTSDFHIINHFINIKTTTFNNPLTLKFQWIQNIGAASENNGFTAGMSYGELKHPKDWLVYYQFNALDQDVLFSPFTQDDTLRRTNTQVHICGIAYRFHKKIALQLWGLFNQSDGNKNLESRVRLDLNVKF